MPPPKNTLLEGKSAVDAHEHAGYVRDDGNASRLQANPKIQARLAELQTEIAKSTWVTVESLLAELESARQKATDLDQLSAAVRAIESKAKISGLLTQKWSRLPLSMMRITATARQCTRRLLRKWSINFSSMRSIPITTFATRTGEYLIAVQGSAHRAGQRRPWTGA